MRESLKKSCDTTSRKKHKAGSSISHGVTRCSAADYSWVQPEISSKCGKVSTTTVFLDLSLTPVRFQLHKCHSKSFTASATVSPVCLSDLEANR